MSPTRPRRRGPDGTRAGLSRLTAGQIDRLEQGFQQAITDDRFLHRNSIYLDDLYAALTR